MDKRGWNRVEELFEEALERPPETRHTFIAESCHGDTDLLAEVESLLTHDACAPDTFMQPPEESRGRANSFSSREADARIGTKIDRYKIVSVIGTGGMGTVYLARQDRPRRDVALKVMKTGLASRSAARRFELEAQILADLRHPNIAQVFEAGRQRVDETGGPGALYFAMEYVPNARSITTHVDARQLTTAERIRLFAQVCAAVHYGHQQGVVHRDIKPSNILIDDAGQVKVIDFGVAHSTNADVAITTMQTASSRLIGTLQYMSPEQCSGDVPGVDSRSDVYSLGVVLYELLTGETPYDVRSVMLFEAVRIVSDRPPTAPSTIHRQLKGDIEIVLLKALEKDPGQRYQSAAGLAEDLRRVVDGQPIMARPPSLVYVLKRSVIRHKWRTGAILTGCLLILTLIVLALTTQWGRETRQANAELSAANDRAAVFAYGASVSSAESAVLANDTARARAVLDQTKPKLRGWEWRHLSYRADLSLWSVKMKGNLQHLALDPVNRRVAVICDPCSTIDVLDADTGAFIQGLPHSSRHTIAGAFSADGRFLVLASALGLPPGNDLSQIDIWDMDAQSQPVLQHSWQFEELVSSVAFGPQAESTILAAGTVEGGLFIWDLSQLDSQSESQGLEQFRPLIAIQAHDDMIMELAFQPPDGKILATASYDFTVRLWDMDAMLKSSPRATLATLRGHTDYVDAVAFSPDGQTLASGSVDSTVHLWNVRDILSTVREPQTPEKAKTFIGDGRDILLGHTEPVTSLAFDASGERLVSGSVDRTIRCWDIDRGSALSNPEGTQSWTTIKWKEAGTLSGHEGALRDIVFLDGDRILSIADDGMIKSWSIESHKMVQLVGHFTSMTDAVFTPDSRYVITAAGSADDSFIIWDVATCFPLVRRVLRDNESVQGMACWRHGDRVLLATATTVESFQDMSGRLILWDITNPQDPQVLCTPSDLLGKSRFYNRVAVSRDGGRLAGGTVEGQILVWNVRDLEEIKLISTLTPFKTGIQALVFVDSNGEWVASAGNWHRNPRYGEEPKDTAIRITEVEEPQRSMSLLGHLANVVSEVQINPEMNLLASASWDHTVRLWGIEWKSGVPEIHLQSQLKGHTDAVSSICFHPHEPRLLSGSYDRTLKVWDTDFGVEVATLHGPIGAAVKLRFDPNGERLVVASSGQLGRDNVAWLLETGQNADLQHRRSVVMRAHDEVRNILRNRAPTSLEDVKRIIETDMYLSLEVREFAASHLRNFLPSPHWFHVRNVLALKQDMTPEDLRTRVLPWAKLAVEMAPESVRYRQTLDEIKKLAMGK